MFASGICGHCHDFIADAELGRDMAKITAAERLARAVLLFYRGGPWTAWDREVWRELTGSSDATNKTLCDLARLVRAFEEGGP